MTKPKKIKFDISFVTGINKYQGLEAFCRPEYFDRIGIAQGKAEVDKKTGEFRFTPGSGKWYVKHLDKTFYTKQLFTDKIFTDDVLKSLEPIVNDYFRYKSLDEMENSEKEFEETFNEVEDNDKGMDADDFFDEK
jgi:hypothetical protein